MPVLHRIGHGRNQRLRSLHHRICEVLADRTHALSRFGWGEPDPLYQGPLQFGHRVFRPSRQIQSPLCQPQQRIAKGCRHQHARVQHDRKIGVHRVGLFRRRHYVIDPVGNSLPGDCLQHLPAPRIALPAIGNDIF